MIKYIREYYLYTLTMFDVIYTKDGKNTSKILTRSKSLLPETARKYIEYCKEHGKKEEIIKPRLGKNPEVEIIYDASMRKRGSMKEYVTLKEYAEMHGIDPATARQRALRGSFQTAEKMGTVWVIKKDEPYIDHRRRREER